MKGIPVLGLVSLMVAVVPGQSQAGEISRGALLAYTCAGCHGANGNSNGPATPSLAGASRDYFVEVMHQYQADERASTIMGRIARGYGDAEIQAMAEFFSRQGFEPAKSQPFDPDHVEKGARLHHQYCEKCHGKGGASAEDDAGILAGQWTPYLRYTLDDIRTGKSPSSKKMKRKLEEMHRKSGDAGIEQLLDFYASRK
ncbi:c-type cytochrome [Thiolapillus brandeum]|uniref:Cytochrome c, class I n=1 Tax=Thiolapillus brandeum TaxID=1076588 RepID=A0A7U6GK23_9GAMM|nr:c-type cytochrome [Thiolapillus brandeum]BAO45012.1 cytochrome c, class I [Thiolapillus brandeum]